MKANIRGLSEFWCYITIHGQLLLFVLSWRYIAHSLQKKTVIVLVFYRFAGYSALLKSLDLSLMPCYEPIDF